MRLGGGAVIPASREFARTDVRGGAAIFPRCGRFAMAHGFARMPLPSESARTLREGVGTCPASG